MLFLLEDPLISTIRGFTYEHIKSHRIAPNQNFNATDFNGNIYTCKLIFIDKKREEIKYEILSRDAKSSKLNHTLIQAIPDKLYLDKLIEVSTLAGYKKIMLFESSFSPKYSLNLDRIAKISIQAALLAELSFAPQIELVDLNNISRQKMIMENSLVLSQHGVLNQNTGTSPSSEKNIWVGPEGGWSELENKFFEENRIELVCLGSDIIYPAWLAGSVWRMQNV